MLWVEVERGDSFFDKNLVMGGLYRRPGSIPNTFIDILHNSLQTLKNQKKDCTYAGDFNLDILKYKTYKPTNEFLDLNFAMAFTPIINKPTRITSETATIIDNIFTNHTLDNNNLNGIILSDLSDHFPIFTIFFKPPNVQQDTFTRKRSFSDRNKISFKHKINAMNWNPIKLEPDPQKAYSLFQEKLKPIFDSSFPIKKTKNGYTNKCPWITFGLKSSIIKKHKLHIKSLRFPTQQNVKKYKKYKNKLTNILKIVERNYYMVQFDKNKSNLKKSWDVIKTVINKIKQINKKNIKLLVNGRLTDNKLLIAESFNKFFTNVGQNLDNNIPKNLNRPNFFHKKELHT
jgi:hypothetical protein